ncbi:hypothetical protein SERN_2940 [Serinibacter arcticus]|uniref:Uncharacterized protein n=1 Tax=Serinibacter arcticus TaxID=1655435 RepID=A0A4Z1DYL5_9MICO|nr:hypothetical protein SERN_2940 [Serinibacter arcticus]
MTAVDGASITPRAEPGSTSGTICAAADTISPRSPSGTRHEEDEDDGGGGRRGHVHGVDASVTSSGRPITGGDAARPRPAVGPDGTATVLVVLVVLERVGRQPSSSSESNR